MFFYELHEGDDEVYSDAIVVSESEWEPQEFFELVQRIRHDVKDNYERDTLVEAIAVVLERDYGFVFVSDEALTAAVNVSTQEADNFLAEFETDEDDEDDDDETEPGDELTRRLPDDPRGVRPGSRPPELTLAGGQLKRPDARPRAPLARGPRVGPYDRRESRGSAESDS